MTTSKKSIITKAIALIMVLSTLFAFTTISASAATNSSGKSTRTITVMTKGNWWVPGSESITLSQTQGVRTKNVYNWFTGKSTTKTYNRYGSWNISYRSTDGKHSGSAKLTGSSVKINLKPDKTYYITVTWNGMDDTFDSIQYGNFSKLPTWKVKSTYKVSNYY